LNIFKWHFNIFKWHFNIFKWHFNIFKWHFNIFKWHLNLFKWHFNIFKWHFNIFKWHFNIFKWHLNISFISKNLTPLRRGSTFYFSYFSSIFCLLFCFKKHIYLKNSSNQSINDERICKYVQNARFSPIIYWKMRVKNGNRACGNEWKGPWGTIALIVPRQAPQVCMASQQSGLDWRVTHPVRSPTARPLGFRLCTLHICMSYI